MTPPPAVPPNPPAPRVKRRTCTACYHANCRPGVKGHVVLCPLHAVAPTRKAKRPSRAARWSDACAAALQGLRDLEDLRTEYEEWRGNLPENLESSTLAEKLDSVVDLDVSSAVDMVEEAEGMDLPRGFGRD